MLSKHRPACPSGVFRQIIVFLVLRERTMIKSSHVLERFLYSRDEGDAIHRVSENKRKPTYNTKDVSSRRHHFNVVNFAAKIFRLHRKFAAKNCIFAPQNIF